ncbi:hypothetical protein [uncultured Parasutterella sp.]|uniref:hypothetical protein n=3 Tax=uncultured Parasutterella sp. TaxID=1263098 RepID=UPI002591DF72|nr:hypothetical protein [uncultured Parasutterella sp.]
MFRSGLSFSLKAYSITPEEFTQDYMRLPDAQLICLFKLRLGYSLKGSALSVDDIEGLYPQYTNEQKRTLEKVLSKFFILENGLYADQRIENMLLAQQEAEEKFEAAIEQEVLKRLARRKAGLASAEAKKMRAEQQPFNKTSTDGQQNINKSPTSEQQSFNKLSTNRQQTINKLPTNEQQSFNKLSTNRQQTINKLPTNEQQRSNKTATNTQQTTNKAFATDEEETPNAFNHGHSEDLAETADEGDVPCPHPRTHTRASESDSDSDNFINKKNIKNKSVSESVSDKQVEQLFAQENRECSVDEFLSILKYFGLDEKNLKGWMRRKAENQQAIDDLVRDFKNFDLETFQAVFSRCQAAKDKENKPLSSAIAFVVKSLQRESAALRNRSKPTAPKKFAERDYYAGVVRLPDGTLRAAPKQGPQRDYTKGLIQLPDGTWKIDPNYKK